MTKTTTLIATCCLSVLAIPVVAFSCDKDKMSGCTEAKATVLKVNSDKATCGTKTARQLVDAARVSQGCTEGKGVASVLTAAAGECESACPKTKTVNFLMRSLKSGCSDACASKTDVVSALRTMATYEKGLVCETSLNKLAGVANVRTAGDGASCSTAKSCDGKKASQVVSAPLSDCSSKSNSTVLAVAGSSCSSSKGKNVANVTTVGSDSGCCASKGKKAQVANVTTVGSDSGSCASKGKNAQVANVTTASGTCSSSAKYVAYGCDKSDRIARAAAKAYIAMMSELKDMNETESCSLEAAQKVLATVMADMQRDTKTEVASVSLGAVSNIKTTAKGSSCSTSKSSCDAK